MTNAQMYRTQAAETMKDARRNAAKGNPKLAAIFARQASEAIVIAHGYDVGRKLGESRAIFAAAMKGLVVA